MVAVAKSAVPARPNRTSLPSIEIPEVPVRSGFPASSARVQRREGPEEDDEHHAVEDVPLPPVADGLAEHERGGSRDEEDQEDLEEVGEGVRVLEGVGGVRVEEPAAVGPELLDRLLRGDRAHRDRLRGAVGRDVRVEVLDDTLGGENEGGDEREGEEKSENDAGQIDPEVADPVRLAAGEPADQGDHDRDAGRGREEVLDREPGHLREVARGDLARVRLPVGVGHERDGGVQGEVGGEARHAGRVEREDALDEEQDEEERKADGVEEEEVAGIPAPASPRPRGRCRAGGRPGPRASRRSTGARR